jgi:hypothetical protein
MRDYQKHLEKLCADAAECVLISDQATNPEKQHRLQGSSRSVGNRGKRSTTQGGSVLLKPVARKFLSKQITCLHGMSRCQLRVKLGPRAAFAPSPFIPQ